MTIRTVEAGLPSSFPPARLFLDDIEEIVRVLASATEDYNRERGYEDAETKINFQIGNRVCDQVEDLPKMAAKTTQLEIEVEKGDWAGCSLIFYTDFTSVNYSIFTEHERLSLFNKLAPIFKRRNRWLATVVQSHPAWYGALATLLCLWPLTALILAFGKKITPIWAIMVGLPPLAAIVVTWVTGSLHGAIVFRRSTEPSPLRQELLHKFPLVAISSALTFLLTLLGLYLKHKYWP